MNEHDQALLDLYNLMMARKAVRLYLKLGSQFTGMSDIINDISKAYPQAMLMWVKESNEAFKKAISNLTEKSLNFDAMVKAYFRRKING